MLKCCADWLVHFKRVVATGAEASMPWGGWLRLPASAEPRMAVLYHNGFL